MHPQSYYIWHSIPTTLLEEKMGKFHDIGFNNDFLGYGTKTTGNKRKNRQVALHQH